MCFWHQYTGRQLVCPVTLCYAYCVLYKTRMNNEIAVSSCPSSYVISGITVGEIWYC